MLPLLPRFGFLVGLPLFIALGGCATSAPPPPAPLVNPWTKITAPTAGPARSIGAYAAGCLDGAVVLPPTGSGYLRAYPDRDRPYGHPVLIAFIERLGKAAKAAGERPLFIGDLGLPRGGPTLSGHASHQTGLDVDIAFRRGKTPEDPRFFGREQRTLLRRMALDAEVERIFVNPRIKQALCAEKGRHGAWFRKVRPWYGHDTHYHVRLLCPADSPACATGEPLPEGDGCDATLAWWDSEEARKETAKKTDTPLALPALPEACAPVLAAPDFPAVSARPSASE